MKKIFIEENIIDFDSKVRIMGKDFNHMSNSLRVSVGEEFVVGDASYNEFLGIISEVDKNEILIEIKNRIVRKRNDIDVTLFFSALKGDKNEDIIRKCSEI
ncbi:MAG TPA: RsmE family RNA methyltransferase, partial [Spirochaetota bacterium]|nr:RsmE family RNA methyltransferase [Spirochaetota bacterium]